jgi:hypothetical protein
MRARITNCASVLWLLGMIVPAVMGCSDSTNPDSTNTQPPTGGSSIPLIITRFDGGQGSALVSNGIPFGPGKLFPDQLKSLQVWVGDAEQRIRVTALEGLHPDGSVRSVLVQFYASVSSQQPGQGTLIVGPTRTTTDLTTLDPAITGQAVALPGDATYLVSTDFVGPTVTATESSQLGGNFLRYEQDFVKYADQHWAAEGSAWENDYYDRALIYYAFWVRTGNPEYWNRGTQFALSYRKNYLEANAYASSPHWSQLEGLEKHYLLTGDDADRRAISEVARIQFSTGWSPYLEVIEDRIRARYIQANFLGWRINAGNRKAEFAAALDNAIPRILKQQRADGSYHPTDGPTPATSAFCGEQANYQTGLMNEQFIQYYTYYRADPAIVTAVQRSADFMWSTQWIADKQAMSYMSGPCTPEIGGYGPAGDLNNMMINTFAWTFAKTGQVSYRNAADAVFQGALVNSEAQASKQFNEQYSTSYRYLAWRK